MRSHLVSLTALASLTTPVLSWGEFGHQMTATIAQIHLFPSTFEAVRKILPGTFKGQLAGVASWPDMIKIDPKFKHFAPFHFVNAKGDDLPKNCDFGSQGWTSPNNILNGIVDRTRQIADADTEGGKRDEALRFLVHFLGDLHQPFHLAGRDLGGNRINVTYNKRQTNLHAVWDDSLIEDIVVHLPNYTSPLPTTSEASLSPAELARNIRVEDALRGSPYDPYIRWILLEGVSQWWADEKDNWTVCPQLSSASAQFANGQLVVSQAPFDDPVDLPVCPYHWASQTHPLLCGPDSVWPAHLTNKTEWEEVNTPQYADAIRGKKIIEKQLALGGIRLAAILNAVLGSEEDKAKYGAVPSLM